jgi:hypothetical protein
MVRKEYTMKTLMCVILAAFVCGAGFAQQMEAFADKPAVLTSVGQSADMEMVRVLLTRAKVPFRSDALIAASGLAPNDKTLILVIGGSSKGLGAAGISAEDEMKRSQALVKKARDLGMKIIALHVGGEARRGTLSDGFIKFAVPTADYLIVVADADKDGLFTSLTKDAKIPLNKVEKISAPGTPLAPAFK